MKTLLTITVGIFLIFFGCSKDDFENSIRSDAESDLAKNNLIGNVKSVNVNEFQHINQILKRTANNYAAYDEEGNYIERKENYYGVTGTLNREHTYKYDERGNHIESEIYSYYGYGNDKTVPYRNIYRYDANNSLIESNIHWQGKVIYKWLY